MFSVIFPGQGSQMIGMGKEFYDKFQIVKDLFRRADETLEFNISKLILEGPKEELDATVNTQPAIYLISYSRYNHFDLNKFINYLKENNYSVHELKSFINYLPSSFAEYGDFERF